MGIIHTPRVIATIAKGMWKQSSNLETRTRIGLAEPHLYCARAGLVDYAFGHLNNAAFFSHAEYARWAMAAENGWMNAMLKNRALLVVASQSCRYRAEIKPFYRKFDVETSLLGMDDRNMWFCQNFRHSDMGERRVRAQLLVKGVLVQSGKVIDPRSFLIEDVGTNPDMVDGLHRSKLNHTVGEIIDCFEALEDAKRKLAAIIDPPRAHT